MLRSDPKKFVCLHGHFYQPPRENAWLGVVEYQESAHPFHNWNERINFECYAPNGAARLLSDQQEIKGILSNYAHMSFNFGPTLLAWMEKEEHRSYEAILDADRASMQHFGGHGSAIAQVYNHIIMPLANRRDKETQIIWGIRDFESRFLRSPEGMWLAETAVDTETLELLALHGIRYTILAPRQAKAFRKIGASDWISTQHTPLDTRQAYLCPLPSGKHISLFFYDGNIAQAVAFGGLLHDGRKLAERCLSVFDADNKPQLCHVATDGESYGHHHAHGEMALASCLEALLSDEQVALTNYGQFLARFPPEMEVQIHAESSWSCVHGVERWRSDCGCHTGGNPSWHQQWRAPLRKVLDGLRDQLIPLFEQQANPFLKDSWAARNDYICIILDRSKEKIQSFFATHALGRLSDSDQVNLLRLLEMQRHAMLMFTSCGWFFDEVSGLETDQILQYAHRAMVYAEQVTPAQLRADFLRRLTEIPSNVYANGAVSYKEKVIPAAVSLERVGMHFAASSLFEDYPEELSLFSYRMRSLHFKRWKTGNYLIAAGRTSILSLTTFQEKEFSFAAMYLGQFNLEGQIDLDIPPESFDKMIRVIDAAINSDNSGRILGIMQNHCGGQRFSIHHLFRDEKRKIIGLINQQSLQSVAFAYRGVFAQTFPLMQGLREIDMPIPAPFLEAAAYVHQLELKEILAAPMPDKMQLESILRAIREWSFKLSEKDQIIYVANKKIYSLLQGVAKAGEDAEEKCQHLSDMLNLLSAFPFNLNLWRSQNYLFSKPGITLIRSQLSTGHLTQESYTRLLLQMGISPQALGTGFPTRERNQEKVPGIW